MDLRAIPGILDHDRNFSYFKAAGEIFKWRDGFPIGSHLAELGSEAYAIAYDDGFEEWRKHIYRRRYIDDVILIFNIRHISEILKFVREDFYPGLVCEHKFSIGKVEYLGLNLEFTEEGFFELSPIIKDIKIVGKSYGAEPRSIIKGYIRRIIDLTVSRRKREKVLQLVGETVDMLNSRRFNFNKARVLSDAERIMREYDIGEL